LSVRI